MQDGDYIPKLYILNSNWQPECAPPSLESAINSFESRINALIEGCQQRHFRANLTGHERSLLLNLREDPKLLCVVTDKNLGPAIIDTKTYIDRCLQEHLLSPDNYGILTDEQFAASKKKAFEAVLDLTVRNNEVFAKDSRSSHSSIGHCTYNLWHKRKS